MATDKREDFSWLPVSSETAPEVKHAPNAHPPLVPVKAKDEPRPQNDMEKQVSDNRSGLLGNMFSVAGEGVGKVLHALNPMPEPSRMTPTVQHPEQGGMAAPDAKATLSAPASSTPPTDDKPAESPARVQHHQIAKTADRIVKAAGGPEAVDSKIAEAVEIGAAKPAGSDQQHYNQGTTDGGTQFRSVQIQGRPTTPADTAQEAVKNLNDAHKDMLDKGDLIGANALMANYITPMEARFHQLHSEEMQGYLSELEMANTRKGVPNDNKLQLAALAYAKFPNSHDMHVEKGKDGVSYLYTTDGAGNMVRQKVTDELTNQVVGGILKYGSDEYRGTQGKLAKQEAETEHATQQAGLAGAQAHNTPIASAQKDRDLGINQQIANQTGAHYANMDDVSKAGLEDRKEQRGLRSKIPMYAGDNGEPLFVKTVKGETDLYTQGGGMYTGKQVHQLGKAGSDRPSDAFLSKIIETADPKESPEKVGMRARAMWDAANNAAPSSGHVDTSGFKVVGVSGGK